MSEIKKLSLPDLKDVYRKYMKEDFPLMELRPWFSIEKAWNGKEYSAYGYYGEERLLAYAAFYSFGEPSHILLDYFAVVPGERGRGIGSSFLQDLLPVLPETAKIFIETENPSLAKNREDREKRDRRLDFYLKNGAKTTEVNCLLFGVDYNILYFSGNEEIMTQEEIFDEVCRLYQKLYRSVYGRLCKPYRNE